MASELAAVGAGMGAVCCQFWFGVRPAGELAAVGAGMGAVCCQFGDEAPRLEGRGTYAESLTDERG